MFTGIGTVVNVASVLVGTGIGVLVGHRLGQRTRDVVTDGLGLVTLLIAASSAFAVKDDSLTAAVGDSAPMLIVLGSIVLGGITGSLLGIERRLEGFGGWLQEVLTRRARRSGNADGSVSAERLRFIEGFVTSSLVFCVGPLTVLGSINDGLGNGADQLYLKSALDCFAAIAFAASFGWGVGASVVALVVVQGSLTLLGVGARRRASRRRDRSTHRRGRSGAGRRCAAPSAAQAASRRGPAAGAGDRTFVDRRGRSTALKGSPLVGPANLSTRPTQHRHKLVPNIACGRGMDLG